MRRRSGYTLIEAVVVLAILGIALSLVTPMVFRGISGTRLKATARRMTSAIRYARNLAITRRAAVYFAVDLDSETYSLQVLARDMPKLPTAPTPDGGVPAPGDDGGAAKITGKTETIEPPVEIISFTDTGGHQSLDGSFGIVFFPKGNSTGGAIEIGKPDSQHLLLTIDPVTSNVDVTYSES